MIVSIDDLLKGKPTKIRKKEYPSTEQLVTPFLERMSKFTDNFSIQVKVPDQTTKTNDTEDITYNRVWIQAVMPEEYAWDNHDEVIGFLYGLDTRKPIVKMYRGGLNRACTNLCVFDPSFLNVQELKSDVPINYKPITNLMEQTCDLKLWLKNLKETYWDRDEEIINQNLGAWIRRAMRSTYDNGFIPAKLGVDTVMDAYKLLFEKDESPYYIKESEQVNMFTVYNAFTELISNDNGKDLVNKVEKTLLLRNILDF